MCGFFCYLEKKDSLKSNLLESSLLNVKYLKNRGPDGSNQVYLEYEKYNLFLYHARLAIQDISDEFIQPYLNKKSNNLLIYNGEIYDFGNYKSKISEYSCDTAALSEVLNFSNFNLSELDGMYSFISWDPQKHLLTIARDRFGIKPLFLYSSNKVLALSSSLKMLAKVFNLSNINYQYAKESILIGHSFNNKTIFKEVNEFPTNQLSVFNPVDFSFQNKKIFNNSLYLQNNHNNKNYENQNLEKSISKSLERQLGNTDRGSGMFLSGGVDSSLLVSITLGKKLISSSNSSIYSLKNLDPKIDESNRVKEFLNFVDNEKKIKFTESSIDSNSYIELIKDYIDLDYPILDLGILPIMKLCKDVDSKLRVILSGDGADELFGGYERNYIALKRYNIIKKIPKKIISLGKSFLPHKLKKYLEIRNIIELRCLLMGTPITEIKDSFDFFNEKVKEDSLTKMLTFEQNEYLKNVLAKVDAASMRYSLEVRVPYLSNLITLYVANKNPKRYLKNNIKFELKDLLKKYTSKNFSNLEKKGFNVGYDDEIKKINKLFNNHKKLFFDYEFDVLLKNNPMFLVRYNLLNHWLNG